MDQTFDQPRGLRTVTLTHAHSFTLKRLAAWTLAITALMGALFFLVGFPPAFDTFYEKMYFHAPCPICLARGTKIATPGGEVALEALRPGDPVWTLDRLGRRVPAAVVQVGSTPVPAGHEVVRLVLADGRAVLASPGHPLPDGRPVATLRDGDLYDGSVVASADRIPYDDGRTFDLLPSGGTGVYWANGIELGSTLFR